MNKLRLIKIYEIRKQVHPIEATIIDLLDGIEKEIYPEYILYYKDGRLYFTFILKTNNIYINPNIYKLFKCSYEESLEIMKYLLEKHLGIIINRIYYE